MTMAFACNRGTKLGHGERCYLLIRRFVGGLLDGVSQAYLSRSYQLSTASMLIVGNKHPQISLYKELQPH